jgi:hypothetical protein
MEQPDPTTLTERRTSIGCGVVALQLTGIGVFLYWLSETDFMFGHYEAPMIRLMTAGLLCALGVGASIWWWFFRRARTPVAKPMSRRAKVLQGLLIALTALLDLLCLLVVLACTLEAMDAADKAMNKAGRGLGGSSWLEILFGWS